MNNVTGKDSNVSENPLFQDLKELHDAIYKCRLCQEIGKKVTNIQPPWDPSRGKPKAQKWGMLIGQAPGKEETRRALKVKESQSGGMQTKPQIDIPGGIAFSGDGGQRFFKWLMESGLSEEECRKQLHKTAVTKCYPDIWPVVKKRSSDRQPSKKEIELCRHFLEEQIRLVNPKVIIAMGALAIRWFFPGIKLEDAIGKKLQWKGRPVVCFPHASNVSKWWKLQQNLKSIYEAKNILRNLKETTM